MLLQGEDGGPVGIAAGLARDILQAPWDVFRGEISF